MQNALAEQMPAQRLHERLELHAALADPAGHAGWRDVLSADIKRPEDVLSVTKG